MGAFESRVQSSEKAFIELLFQTKKRLFSSILISGAAILLKSSIKRR